MRTHSGSSTASATAAGGAARSAAAAEEVTAASVAKLEKAVTALQEELTECRNTRAKAEQKLKDCRQKVKTLSVDIEKAKQAVSRAREEEQELAERLASLQAECTLSADEQREKQSLESHLASIESNIKRTAPNLKTLESEVDGIQKQILDVGGPKLKRAQFKVDSVNSELNDLTTTLSTKQVEVTNTKKQVCTSIQTYLCAEVSRLFYFSNSYLSYPFYIC